jgi:type IV pilus assembly protein PilB
VNDFASATTSLRQALQGLPQRLVADGLVSEVDMLAAIATARERRVTVVSYLVEHNLAEAREIAISAAKEFGVPLLDLDAIQPDLEIVRLVSEKLLRKHRVLPLVKRGKRLFVAVSDPTDFERLHSQHLTRLPGVARVQSSFALRTVRKSSELPIPA